MNSMIVSLTDNMEERDTILKNKGIFAGIFTMLAGVIWTVLISEHVGLPIQAVALVSSVLFFFMMLPLATKVKEHNAELKNAEEAQSAEHYSFKDMLGCIKTNKYVFIILVSALLYTGLQTGGSLGTYAFSFFCFSFAKRKWTGRTPVHLCGKAAGGRFSQGAEVVRFKMNQTTLSTAGNDSSTRTCCGIVWRLPQKPHPPRRAHEPDQREGYHRLLRRW